MTVVKPKYVVIVRGPTPSGIAQRVSEAHAVALASAKSRRKKQNSGLRCGLIVSLSGDWLNNNIDGPEDSRKITDTPTTLVCPRSRSDAQFIIYK